MPVKVHLRKAKQRFSYGWGWALGVLWRAQGQLSALTTCAAEPAGFVTLCLDEMEIL